ncbi:hypothetical protein BGZ80_005336 [Entomortierella chlamydospora]|uniref:Kelch repeat protein n=1 Tax=Entomortierella chlamydospora TaxID=101097 RepID=A0A9P6N0T8_9FUNG
MDSTQNYSVFASTPISELSGTTANWTKLPDPPQWKSMTSYYPSSQFDCAATSDGKVFLFGNDVGFAQYDIQSAKWDDTPPKFTSTGVSMKNLLNQQGLRATVDIDRTSIVIVSSSPPTFMRLNPQTKEISGTSIYTITSGLRGFCLGIIQKNPEKVILCGGSYYHQESSCYELVTQSTSVYTNSFNSLPSSQEGCSIVSHDAGYFVNQGLMSSNANAPSWTDNNSGSSSSVFYSVQNGLWTEYHNSLSNSYPLRGYSAATYIPNMKMAVIYGGVLPGQNTSSEIYTLNLTDTISSYKGDSGSSSSSGFSLIGLLAKIFGSLFGIGVVLGILKV